MSQFFDIADPGCASIEAFSRTRALTTPPVCDRQHSTLDTSLSDSAKILRSIAYMQEHLTERIQVSKLASRINVSPSHFFAFFKRRTGYAPIDFFIHLRMRRACHLLDTTKLRVKQIADQLGYDDPFYFSRLFKSVVALAPTEYRLLPSEVREDIAARMLPQKLAGSGSHWANVSGNPATLEPPEARA